MKPLLSKEEIADLLTPLEPEAGKLPDQPLQIRIEAACSQDLLKKFKQIQNGETLALDTFTDLPLDLYLDNQRIASCELVQDNDTFSLKVTEVFFAQKMINQQG